MAKDNWISVSEAAKILGYSRVHVVRLIQAGKISAKKIGRAYVVDINSFGDIYKPLSKADEAIILQGTDKVTSEYADALRQLGKE